MLYYAGKMSGGEKNKRRPQRCFQGRAPPVYFMDPACRDRSETHTVKEYLGSFEIHAKDEFFMKWKQTVLKLFFFSSGIRGLLPLFFQVFFTSSWDHHFRNCFLQELLLTFLFQKSHQSLEPLV